MILESFFSCVPYVPSRAYLVVSLRNSSTVFIYDLSWRIVLFVRVSLTSGLSCDVKRIHDKLTLCLSLSMHKSMFRWYETSFAIKCASILYTSFVTCYPLSSYRRRSCMDRYIGKLYVCNIYCMCTWHVLLLHKHMYINFVRYNEVLYCTSLGITK
jgi:hypothetical protein